MKKILLYGLISCLALLACSKDKPTQEPGMKPFEGDAIEQIAPSWSGTVSCDAQTLEVSFRARSAWVINPREISGITISPTAGRSPFEPFRDDKITIALPTNTSSEKREITFKLDALNYGQFPITIVQAGQQNE